MWTDAFPWQQPLNGDAETHWQLESLAPTPSPVTAAEPISRLFIPKTVSYPLVTGQITETLCPLSSHCPGWHVEVGETFRHDACKHVSHSRSGSVSQWSFMSRSQVDHTCLFGWPKATTPDLEASSRLSCPFCLSFSCPFHVFILLAQDRHLIFEEHRIQAKLRVNQGHVAKPAGKSVDALLPLVEVLWVGPLDTLGTLGSTHNPHYSPS